MTTPILAISNLRKRYGGRFVVDGVSLSLNGPAVLSLRGENGAGKSTLLSILAGVLEQDEGTISIAGHDLTKDRVGALRNVGYAPDKLELPLELTVAELVALVASLRAAPKPEKSLIERLGVLAFWGDRLGALSLGQRRRAALLLSLIGDPKLLILDEPTNGLDVEGLDLLAALLRERVAAGKSVLIATHDAAFAERVADERCGISHGRLVESRP
jgi:ABC-2 type transport system ATP-binding protein